jgi:universal stress protein E
MTTTTANPTRVLVFVDALAGESGAMAAAIRLARATDARLTIMDVVDTIPSYVERLLPTRWNVADVVRDTRLEGLEWLARRARRLEVRAEAVLREGHPVVAVVQEVLRGGHDLLILDASALQDEEGSGAIARRLVRKSPCAALVVRGAPPRARPRVLAAVDPNPEAAGSAEMTAKVLAAAARMTTLLDGEMHVAHAWSAHGEFGLRGRLGIPEEIIVRYLADTEREAEAHLDRALERYEALVPPERRWLAKGRPAYVIPRIARQKEVDLLVVGTVARTASAGVLVGNTAESLLSRAECSLLVVHPDGFVSPIPAAVDVPSYAAATAPGSARRDLLTPSGGV